MYLRDKDGRITGRRTDVTPSEWQTAFDDFGEALRADPDFEVARQNLAVAHNNLALTLVPAKSIREFHQSVFIDDSNVTTVQNMDAVIKALGKDPANVADRVSLGDEARQSGDLVGAVVEYRAALKIKNDLQIHRKLAQVYQDLKEPKKAAEEFAAAGTK